MLAKMLAGAVAAVLMLAMAGAASAQVSVTASYGAASRVGAGQATISFTIVNTGPAVTNLEFLYLVTGPTSWANATMSGICTLSPVATATRVAIGVAPAAGGKTLGANTTCSFTVSFTASVGTHTLTSTTLSYDGGSVNLTPGANPTLVVAPVPPIPTLSEWGLILMGLILAGGAALIVQRRLGRA